MKGALDSSNEMMALTSLGQSSNAKVIRFFADWDRSNMYPLELSLVATVEMAADECDHEL